MNIGRFLGLGQFFRIRKTDRQIITLLLLIALVCVGMVMLTGEEQTADTTAAVDSAAADVIHRKGNSPVRQQGAYYDEEPVASRTAERFVFDPNTADSTQLLRLGLEPWMVHNIYKYRAHGGIYRTKEDFAKVYGLTVGQYRSLEPYIRIGRDYQPAATLIAERETPPVDTLRRLHKIAAGEKIDLATADTTQLKRVPGIGSYYANCIARYGQRLGGFVSVDQLDEIDELPPNVKQYFSVDAPNPVKLNLNKLSISELKRHPYLNYYQAQSIIDYRRLHGPLHSLDDLKLLRDFPPEVIQRLAPYVCF
jgi:DNA uptake protein ComE-like DNA-binding protein